MGGTEWGRQRYVAAATIALFLVGYSILFMTGASSIRHLLDNLIAGYLIAWGLYGLLTEVPRAEVGKRFVLTTLSIALCLALVESTVLLRLVDFRNVFGTFESQNALSSAGRRFDSELLWRHEPYYAFEAEYQGNLGRALCIPPDSSQRVQVQYDRNGFRNAQDWTQADIVVIGDSYIEAPMVADDALSTTLLSRLQGRTVANLGNSGYGPQQELGVLKRFGVALQPKTVIWAFFEGNDFTNTDEYDVKVALVAGQNPHWQDFWFRSLSRNLLALYFRTTGTCEPNPRIQQFRGRFSDRANGSTPVFFAPTEVVYPSDEELRRVTAYILEAAQLCREQNIRFIVLFVPEKYRVYHDLANFEVGTEELRSWRVSDLPQRLQRLLAREDSSLEYVDLTPALKAESRKGIATYLHDDTHWSPAGHRVVAEVMHRVLSSPPVRKSVRLRQL